MRVAVVGAAGMLGKAVVQRFTDSGDEVGAYTRAQLDVTDGLAVRQAVEATRPAWVINCAAQADVDHCENNVLEAYRINALAPWNLAAACRSVGAGLVQVSTDYVFDGTKVEPYIETDPTRPINVYGKSKLEGEMHVAAVAEKYYVVRTAWLFGPTKNNFVPWVLEVAKSQPSLHLIDDQWGSPTYVADLAEGISWLARQAPLYGVYHVVNRGQCTRKQLAEMAISAAGLHTPVEGIPMSALPRPAPRPARTPLRNWALDLRGGWNARPYQEALEDFVRSWLSG